MRTATYLAMMMAAALPVSAIAQGQAPLTGSHVDIYYSNLDFEVEFQGSEASIDGDGGGIDFWFTNNNWGLFTAEIQANKLDGNVQGTQVDADARYLRAGLGVLFANTADGQVWLRGEYIDFDGDIDVQGLGTASDRQKGWGVHFGGKLNRGPISGYAEIGRGDLDDLDGFEYTIGLNYQPGPVGGFVEYRGSDLETDELGIDERFSDIRAGVRLAF